MDRAFLADSPKPPICAADNILSVALSPDSRLRGVACNCVAPSDAAESNVLAASRAANRNSKAGAPSLERLGRL